MVDEYALHHGINGLVLVGFSAEEGAGGVGAAAALTHHAGTADAVSGASFGLECAT